MPIYEYQCIDCKHVFSEISSKVDALKVSTYCPNCKKKGKESFSKRIISKNNFVVNGFNASNGYAKKRMP